MSPLGYATVSRNTVEATVILQAVCCLCDFNTKNVSIENRPRGMDMLGFLMIALML